MLDDAVLNFLRHLAKGLADQFGSNCEVVIHDLSDNYKENSIVAIKTAMFQTEKSVTGRLLPFSTPCETTRKMSKITPATLPRQKTAAS